MSISPPHDDREALDDARWPQKFLDLARESQDAHGGAKADACRARLWTMANLAIQKYVRIHAKRHAVIGPEDVRDISSAKTLDLLRRLEQHEWEPGGYTPAQLCAFVAAVARNGVLDHVRSRRHETQAWWDETDSGEEAPARAEPIDPGDASREAEAAEGAAGIADCLTRMTTRARLVWLLRVFYEMSSEAVAGHPDLRTTPAAVDTMLLRCRRHLQQCAREKGFDPAALPIGTLTTLWEMVMNERNAILPPPGPEDTHVRAGSAATRREPPDGAPVTVDRKQWTASAVPSAAVERDLVAPTRQVGLAEHHTPTADERLPRADSPSPPEAAKPREP